MPIYIVKVSTSNGGSKLIRVKAQNAEHAQNGLKQKGFKIELIKGELDEGFSTETSEPHFVELAQLQAKGSTILLTSYNIRQEIISGLDKVIKIVPLHNIDSFGIIKQQKTWLAVIAGIMIIVGIAGIAETYEYRVQTEAIKWWGNVFVGNSVFGGMVINSKNGRRDLLGFGKN